MTFCSFGYNVMCMLCISPDVTLALLALLLCMLNPVAALLLCSILIAFASLLTAMLIAIIAIATACGFLLVQY